MSKDSDSDYAYGLLLWIIFFATCNACDNSKKATHKTEAVENRIYDLEKKMDTLIKYEKQNNK